MRTMVHGVKSNSVITINNRDAERDQRGALRIPKADQR